MAGGTGEGVQPLRVLSDLGESREWTGPSSLQGASAAVGRGSLPKVIRIQ